MATILMDGTRYVPPTVANFGAATVGTNAENPTVTDTTGRGLVLDFGSSPAASVNVRGVFKAKTAGSTQSIIWRMQPMLGTYGQNNAGVSLRESSSGKLLTFGIDGNSQTAFVSRYTNPTTFSANQITFGTPGMLSIEWFKITLVADDPKGYYISRNGTDWIQILDQTQTPFLTFDQVGPTVLFQATSGTQPVTTTNRVTNSILYYKDAGIIPSV